MVKLKEIKKRIVDDTPPLEDQINDIIDNFNFDLVAEYMEYFGRGVHNEQGDYIGRERWKMACEDGFHVPTVSDLKTLARRLLEDVISKLRGNYTYVATGPFKAIRRYDILELNFVPESWSYD